ncbi:hypothetical protein [Streptomyces sp. NPDC007883]|uniref:hypothetical protein n=1 Tax=Streptomyces sp. NPDC007883 TaxID=3155116 RepID=UPI0033DD76FE
MAEGCVRYEVGPGPESTEAGRTSSAAWQRKLGHAGSDADGIPGTTGRGQAEAARRPIRGGVSWANGAAPSGG